MGWLFGDDDSSSSTSSTTNATNTAYNSDKRAVASEEAVSLTGDGNSVDRSTTTQFFDTSTKSSFDLTSFIDNSNRSTNFADTSNRSTNSNTSMLDMSDRSTNFADSSNRSTTTTTTITDMGSVSGALGLSGSMTLGAYNLAGGAVTGAIDVLKMQTKNSQDTTMAAFGMASKNAENTSASVLGFAATALKQSNDAFANASDGGQSKMVMVALGVVAAIAVACALR